MLDDSRSIVVKIDDSESAEIVRATLWRIFRSTDTLNSPILTEAMSARMIGFPFWQHDLTAGQWSVFVQALLELNYAAEHDYVVATTLPGAREFWKVGVEVDYPYPELVRLGWPSVWENAIFTPTGEWVLIILDEEFGIAAGDSRFVKAIRRHMPEFQASGVAQFIDHWRLGLRHAPQHARVWTWLPAILEDVLGEEGRQLAVECGALS